MRITTFLLIVGCFLFWCGCVSYHNFVRPTDSYNPDLLLFHNFKSDSVVLEYPLSAKVYRKPYFKIVESDDNKMFTNLPLIDRQKVYDLWYQYFTPPQSYRLDSVVIPLEGWVFYFPYGKVKLSSNFDSYLVLGSDPRLKQLFLVNMKGQFIRSMGLVAEDSILFDRDIYRTTCMKDSLFVIRSDCSLHNKENPYRSQYARFKIGADGFVEVLDRE